MDFARTAREGHSVSRTAKEVSLTYDEAVLGTNARRIAEDLMIFSISRRIAEQDVKLRPLLDQITRERADMNASARIEGRKDIEHA